MNQSGGVQGGASAFSGLSDVAISSPSTGQVPVYNSGTSKWENGAVSATDSTKLPKDGSSSMSGPVVFGADSSTTSANYEIVRISNKLVRNAPSGKAISDRINGVEMLSLDGNGDTFALGRVDDGYNYVVGAYGSNFYNCPTSGSHVFRVQGAVVGHFPLTPSDMPKQTAVKTDPVTVASDGTWTDLYDLSAGAHYGQVKAFSTIDEGYAIYTIGSTSFNFYANVVTTWWAASGSAASGNVSLRISGGKIQIYRGSGISNTHKFSIQFLGQVV